MTERNERRERQQRMLDVLAASRHPITGAELAERCGVTRQVVVHDIALLRASGVAIHSTPRGYWLAEAATGEGASILAVKHPPELTQTELYILVDHGIRVVDVFVEHAVYGELRGSLHLSSRRDVDNFLESVRTANAPLLSSLTEGFHFHTVEAPDDVRLREAVAALRQAGIEVEDT
ncbi:transcriptional regulator [Alicyclobacillus contaminans]|uniref:transcription repressor NadR n=1 Tax=Alicyclobacillus contaminans TaxID=392016 RepID=UPI00040E7343|nr:transcription repressor NadR [Alicyclobacillus contaminans]GMA51518.1 transcriptional regulator [Alicyclobacillus contaminans]